MYVPSLQEAVQEHLLLKLYIILAITYLLVLEFDAVVYLTCHT